MRMNSSSSSKGAASNGWTIVLIVVGFSFSTGYLIGFLAKDALFTSDPEAALHLSAAQGHGDSALDARNAKTAESTAKAGVSGANDPFLPTGKRLRGDTIHTLVTSSGDGYQNFQNRIMYASYLMVQKMPGGEHMTGFTRILHRTVPDILMEEVPTFHVWDVKKPQCDGWCDYPVANRPNAIMQFFRAAAADPSMIQGAWLYMTECDYVWMSPANVPGNAYDASVPGFQYFFDYIIPQHPDAAPHIQKLFGEGKNISLVPASGPAPAIIRFNEWMAIGNDYERLTDIMEKDEPMKIRLGWVREMYAWDVAVAMHPEVTILTEKPPASRLMVQPPFDEGMFNASLVHYTWGVLYHEGKPSEKAKQIYRWEKRDFSDIKHAIKPSRIPMPPPYREGLILEFDSPLNEKRHALNVLYLTQLNKAIDTLSDLTEYAKKVDTEIVPAFRKATDERVAQKLAKNIKFVPWSLPRDTPTQASSSVVDTAAVDKAAAEKAATEKAAVDKAAVEKAAADAAAVEKVAVDKAALEKAAADKAATDKAAADQAVADKVEAEKDATDKSAIGMAAAVQAVVEKTEAATAVVEKAAADTSVVVLTMDEKAATSKVAADTAVEAKGAADDRGAENAKASRKLL